MKSTDHIRKARKEAQYLRVISTLFASQTAEDARLLGIFINRVELSADGGLCYVFFYSAAGQEAFKELLPHLILYKPSLRAAVAKEIPGRYTPDIIFRFDENFEKQQRIEQLIEKAIESDRRYAPMVSTDDQSNEK